MIPLYCFIVSNLVFFFSIIMVSFIMYLLNSVTLSYTFDFIVFSTFLMIVYVCVCLFLKLELYSLDLHYCYKKVHFHYVHPILVASISCIVIENHHHIDSSTNTSPFHFFYILFILFC